MTILYNLCLATLTALHFPFVNVLFKKVNLFNLSRLILSLWLLDGIFKTFTQCLIVDAWIWVNDDFYLPKFHHALIFFPWAGIDKY